VSWGLVHFSAALRAVETQTVTPKNGPVPFDAPMNVPMNDEQATRQLRLRIGRLRRRIDRRARAVAKEGRRLTSWRTYVTRYTGTSLALAFGVGLALSTGLSGRRLLRRLAAQSIREGLRGVGRSVAGEVKAVWADSSRKRSGAATGENHHA
jgi:hypothetical protein